MFVRAVVGKAYSSFSAVFGTKSAHIMVTCTEGNEESKIGGPGRVRHNRSDSMSLRSMANANMKMNFLYWLE